MRDPSRGGPAGRGGTDEGLAILALFGEAPDAIDGIARMGDSDNTGGDATARIAHIGFPASAEPPRCP